MPIRGLVSHVMRAGLAAALLGGCRVATPTPLPPTPTPPTPVISHEVPLEVSSIQVRAAQPKAADARKIEQINQAKGRSAGEVVYIVKLYLDDARPLYTSMGARLFVGEEAIEEYAGFERGIYFKVYDPDFFSEHTGEKVRFTIDGETFIDAGVEFPRLTVDGQPDATRLPTQEEVLSE